MYDIEARIERKIALKQTLDLAEIEQYITQVAPRTTSTIFKNDAGLERSKAFLALIGNPQEAIKTIHIAGTSGKGSVAALIDSLLQAHGFTTGRYSSPHVYELRERWLKNGELAPEKDLSDALTRMYPAIQLMKKSEWGAPTYFEITTAIGFLLNHLWQCDYAIIETGMGGLYDTTNTIHRSDKIAVITQLGLDHTHILGNTLPEIAAQKAGILPYGGQAVVWEPTDEEAKKIIVHTAALRDTEVTYINKESFALHSVSIEETVFDYFGSPTALHALRLSLTGEHQVTNATLALQAVTLALSRRAPATPLHENSLRAALTKVLLPGRFERRILNDQIAIFDGAHNPQKIGALVRTLKSIYPQQRFNWVVAFGQHKDIAESLRALQPLVDTLYITSFFAEQDMPLTNQAANVNDIAKLAKKASIPNIVLEPNNNAAVKHALSQSKNQPIIVAGSFYLLGELKEL